MIQLYNEDCLKVFQYIDDRSIDCVITDCPYHVISGGCTNLEDRLGGFLNADNVDVKDGKMFQHNDIQFSEWMPHIYRVLKDKTHCYIMVNHRNLKSLWEEAEKCGFIFQNLLVWDKGNSTPNKWYMNSYEVILMLRKGKAKNINNMGEKNILRIPNVKNKVHPTEKPSELMRILVENSTKPGETVLDPFMGVGGVGVACQEAGRNFIGIEIDEKYYDVAVDRTTGKKQMSIEDLIKQI